MFKRSWSVVGGLIVCLTLLFTGPMLSARSQSNVDEVIVTEITAESRSGEHPLITTYVSVLDDRNEFVSGLRAGDFTVREFTEPVSGISTSVERQGVAVDVLVDISGSMRDRGTPDKSRLQDVQWAAGQFLGDLSGEDWSSLYTFCEEVDQIRPLEPGGGGLPPVEIPSDGRERYTCLFEAMYEAIDDLTTGTEGRGDKFPRMKKAIFVFSDGADSGLENCRYDLSDVKKLLMARDPRSKISVYAVGVGSEEEYRTYASDFSDLRNLVEVTDGKFIHYFGEGAQERVTAAFDRFLTQGEQYVVQYGTKACADQVTVHVGVGGKWTDKENPPEVAIEPVKPVIELSGVDDDQTISGEVTLKPDVRLEQCPIREVTYYVNGKKMGTMASPFEWEWDTATLPDDPGASPSDEGLIEDVSIRAEAVDQKGLTGEDQVSGIEVQIPGPKVEILKPGAGALIERTGRWNWGRTKCEETEPREETVEIDVIHSSGKRRVEQVRYLVDGLEEDRLQRLPARYALDISSLGCEAVDEETDHALTVEVTDDLGLSGEEQVPLTVEAHVAGFGEAVGGFLESQVRMIPAWLALISVVGLGVYVRVVGTQQAMEQARVGVRKMTEFLGVVSRGTRLVLVEDGEDQRTYAVHDRMSLGRDATLVDVSFDNPGVSRQHATLVKEDDDFVIYDRASKNGTWVNDRRLPFNGHSVLESGDIIELGRGSVELRFEIEEEEAAGQGGGR